MEPIERKLHVLLVDPQATLVASRVDALRSDRVAVHHVIDEALAGRMADEIDVDTVVVLVPEGERARQDEGGAIARLVARCLRGRSRAVVITSADELERRPPWQSAVAGGRARIRRSAGTGAPAGEIVGSAPATARLRQRIARVAQSDRPVLVVGPTGAGKELVVAAIHREGPHPDAPLLDVNCGAIPDALMESLLFGHVRGAFTGADAAQDGYLGAVGHGTLFLDEVAELPPLLQAKLLRVLETRRFRRVGSTEERVFSGRVIAATHADLRARCREHRFREDLYYRLAVLTVDVPPLAARRDDIDLLVAHFAARQSRPLRFTASALAMLRQRPWPGNIRQLRNAIDRIAVACDADPIDAADLGEQLDESDASELEPAGATGLAEALLRLDAHDKLAAAETLLIEAAMREYGGNKSAAARALGVHRKVLERRLGREPGRSIDDELDRDPD